MSNFAAVRDAIKAKLDSIAGIGKVQKFERYTRHSKDMKEFYATGDLLSGGFIRRTGYSSESPEDVTFIRTTAWEIHYFRSWVDEDESSESFDLLIDAIAEKFEQDVTLNGVVQTTKVHGHAGIQLMESKPAMFAGVLVHYAVMKLNTVDVYCND